MKTVMNLLNNKPEEEEFISDPMTRYKPQLQKQNQDEDEYDFEDDFDDEDDLDQDEFETEGEDSDDVFAEFTDKVQSLLDDGAIALEIAEEKTAQLEGMNSGTEEYEQLVEEIKVAQEQARESFEDAEFLIQKANEILEDNK